MPQLPKYVRSSLHSQFNKPVQAPPKIIAPRHQAPPKAPSPALGLNDSPPSSDDESDIKAESTREDLIILDDNQLQEEESPVAEKAQAAKRQHSRRKDGGMSDPPVSRRPGRRPEHHRNGRSSDGLSSTSGKRKRKPSCTPAAAVSAKDDSSQESGFGEAFSSQMADNGRRKNRTTYGSQSRNANIHAAPSKDGSAKSSSPAAKRDSGGFKRPEQAPEAPKPAKPVFRLPAALDALDKNLRTNSKRRRKTADDPINLTNEDASRSSQSPTNSFTKLPTFKQPLVYFSEFSSSDLSSDLSSAPDSIILDSTQEHLDYQSSRPPLPYHRTPPIPPPNDPISTTVPCPMCKTLVDRIFLDNYSNGQKLRSRQALRFCEAHQQRTAQDRWAAAQYPIIDWEVFEERLEALHHAIGQILERRRPSFYREELERKIASGKMRNALRNPEAAEAQISSPGYYGAKGARLMMEHLMGRFGRKLRKIAQTDAVFKAVGVSGFVQAVLVPEVGCCLVMEDLSVNEERAREVLKESAEVGELVNAEEEERVLKRESVDVGIDGGDQTEDDDAMEEDEEEEGNENVDWKEFRNGKRRARLRELGAGPLMDVVELD